MTGGLDRYKNNWADQIVLLYLLLLLGTDKRLVRTLDTSSSDMIYWLVYGPRATI